MRVPWAHQVQERVRTSALVILTDRVDDGALLLGHLVKRGGGEGLERPLPRPGPQRARRGGWTAVLWLASLRTAGEHRQESVEADSQGLPHTLSPRSGQGLTPWAGRAERWGHRLTHGRKPPAGPEIDREWPARRRDVSAWSQAVLRGEATPVAGPHAVRAGGLGPLGPRQDAARRPPRTVLRGSWAPWGMAVATAGLSGERAEDGVSRPRIPRLEAGRRPTGRRLVGEGTMRAWDPRAAVGGRQPLSRSPRPVTGATAEALAAWRREGSAPGRDGARARRFRRQQRAAAAWVAEGSEVKRRGGLEAGDAEWPARGGVGRAPAHAARQAAGLAKRRAPAAPTRAALTPARGRGQRQRTAEAPRVAALAQGRKAPQGEGLLQGAGPPQSERHPHDGGRGRGLATRHQRVMEPSRSHLPRLPRQAGPSRARPQRFGWQAGVTHAPPERRSLRAALWCARPAYRLARLCNRRKSRGPLAPLCVKRHDHIAGLTGPAAARRPRLDGHGVCAVAVSAARSRHTPRLAPGQHDQEDRHAHGGAEPASVCGRCADHHNAGRRRGHPASVDTLVRGAGDHPALSGVGYFSLSAA